MKKKLDSFYLEYMGWIKTKNHLTLLSLEGITQSRVFHKYQRIRIRGLIRDVHDSEWCYRQFNLYYGMIMTFQRNPDAYCILSGKIDPDPYPKVIMTCCVIRKVGWPPWL